MKIYTKGGDSGETGLFGGARVPKDDLRIRTYGTLDELNSVIGLALSESIVAAPGVDGVIAPLKRLQGELFQLGAELATPRGKSTGMRLIADAETERLEREIDAWDTVLPGLKSFVLPGGTRLSAWLHLARTVSRRAERELISLNRAEPARPEVLRYVNRLSDWLFTAARAANHALGQADVPWNAPT